MEKLNEDGDDSKGDETPTNDKILPMSPLGACMQNAGQKADRQNNLAPKVPMFLSQYLPDVRDIKIPEIPSYHSRHNSPGLSKSLHLINTYLQCQRVLIKYKSVN